MSQSLIEIQNNFQDYLLSKSDSIVDEIVSTANIGASKRMDVYANAYQFRLIDTLADNFIGLHGLAGNNQFEQIARQYIDSVPSKFKNIRWYGDQLIEFLTQTAPWNQQVVLAEMAMADWYILLAFDAANEIRVDESAIMELPPQSWSTLKFRFHPSVQRINVTHNVFKFRKQLIEENDDLAAPEKMEQLTGWVIWRFQLKQQYRSLDVDEAWAIDNALKGMSFPQLCEGLCEWIDPQHAVSRAAGFLKQWVTDGLVSEVNY